MNTSVRYPLFGEELWLRFDSIFMGAGVFIILLTLTTKKEDKKWLESLDLLLTREFHKTLEKLSCVENVPH